MPYTIVPYDVLLGRNFLDRPGLTTTWRQGVSFTYDESGNDVVLIDLSENSSEVNFPVCRVGQDESFKQEECILTML